MNQLIDKLLIRIVFTILICLTLVLYKYLHSIFYPSSRRQLFKNFYPEKNMADTIHLFGRILGVGIIMSEFNFSLNFGLGMAIYDLIVSSAIVFIIYLSSLYVLESVMLSHYEYAEEILKKKNMAYGLCCFGNAVATAFLAKVILSISKDSLIMLVILWLFSMVMTGFAVKTYDLISKLPFHKLMYQKNVAIGLAYCGFIWGQTIIICNALNHELIEIKIYSLNFLVKITLSALIFPLLKKAIQIIYQLREAESEMTISGREAYLEADNAQITIAAQNAQENIQPGRGLFEGIVLMTAAYLTTVITGHVDFGSFYPVF